MKISWRWLHDYVDVDLTAEQAAQRLTISGIEIGSVNPVASELSGVVVGQVISKDKHPRADRLSVCQVNVGKEVLTVICGAPNVAAGQKVPMALVGSVLPGGFKIETREIRGVLSQGMICSEKELSISEEAAGIMVLNDDAPIGEALQKVLPLDDKVLEADLTPNRPDCMSMVGIAREVSAICQTSLRKPRVEIVEGSRPVDELVSVHVHDPEACPRYTARLIQGVKIGPAPPWLSRRLVASGVRSLNNVVDVTNYVMMELGQPLHAFDYDLLAGAEIHVRRARDGEKFVTLDDQEHLLNPEILLICDAEKPVALAGIMGGLQSEVTSDTKNILLESAYFQPTTIRRGSKKLNISTESSQRFERGIDPNEVLFALDRAAQFICELAGGEIAKGAADCYPKPIEPQKISLRVQRTNRLLGTKLSQAQMATFLKALCFETSGEDPLEVQVPTFRPDITREIDLIEEIARLYGYDKIEARVHAGGALKVPLVWEEQAIAEIKSALCSLGFYEVVTNSLTAPVLLRALGYGEPLREIINPLSEDLSVLRPSLIPGLLQVLRRNFHRNIRDIRVFELGTTFHPPTREDFSAEKRLLCGAIAGRRWPRSWDQQDVGVDFYDLKGLLESFLNKLSIDNFNFLPYDGGVFQPGFSAALILQDTRCGVLGQLAPEVQTSFELAGDIFLFQLDVATLMGAMARDRRYVVLPKFPTAERDLAIVVDEEVSAGQVDGAIRQAGGDLVVDVRLFDVYRGEQIAAGKKGLAYSLKYQSPKKTLTDSEVEEIQRRIMAFLEEKFKAQLRS